MSAHEARNYVKENDAKLQKMYQVAPFSDEVPNPDEKNVARGFIAFREYIGKKEKKLKESVLQT